MRLGRAGQLTVRHNLLLTLNSPPVYRDGLLPQPPDFGQRRQVIVHAREPLVFEVRLVKVKKS